MIITARVYNQRIELPAGLEIPEGAEVQIILPEPLAPSQEPSVTEDGGHPMAWMKEFIGALDSLPPDAAERHNELAHGRKRRRS